MSSIHEPVTDEQIYAFIDGEIDADLRTRVAAAIDADPALAQRVAQQRQLQQLLRAQFDPVLEEPVPDHLHAAMAPPDGAALDLATARARRSAPVTSRPAWQSWGAQAAALALGLLLGAMFFSRSGSLPYVEQGGELLARGALQEALSRKLSGDEPAGGIAIGLSIRTNEDGFCRSFTLDAGQAGLACRHDDEWRIDLLTRAASSDNAYRQAGSAMPESLRLAIEARAIGDPLSIEDEAIARGAGWRAN